MSSALRVSMFRHTLYLPSERFIPGQAIAIPAAVTMVARDRVRDNTNDLSSVALEDGGRGQVIRHMAGDPRPLESVLRRVETELLHAHFGVEGLFSARAASRLDIPHFTTFHGFDATLSRGSLVSSRSAAWVRFGLQRKRFLQKETGHFVAVSEHIRKLLVRMGAREERVTVIGTGVDTDAIAWAPLPHAPRILHVARLVEKKGTEFLIRAMSDVLRAEPSARLSIVGTGPLESSLKALVRELDLEPNVDFVGVLPHRDVIDQLKHSTVFCLPSITASNGDQEGLGQVLLEASAMGRPVVATRSGGIVDAVVDGVTGVLVAERSVSELAEALTSLLSSTKLSSAMGNSGRVYVLENFDVKRQSARLGALYESVLHHG